MLCEAPKAIPAYMGIPRFIWAAAYMHNALLRIVPVNDCEVASIIAAVSSGWSKYVAAVRSRTYVFPIVIAAEPKRPRSCKQLSEIGRASCREGGEISG